LFGACAAATGMCVDRARDSASFGGTDAVDGIERPCVAGNASS